MLSYTQKRELKAAQRRLLIDSINIQLASPPQIRSWAERRLPTGALVGQVVNSKTLDYKNHKPLKDGLFCERIFGPVRDFVCACGKQKPKDGIRYCLQCGVEFTHSRVRRVRLGYIQLASSVTHIWFLKGRPSYIALLLGKKRKLVVAIAYCNAFLVEQDFPVTQYALESLISTKRSKENSIRLATSPPFKNQREVRHVVSRRYGIQPKAQQLTVRRQIKDSKNKDPNLKREPRKASFTSFYSQAQTLPFLPSLATTYLIRMELVNYLFLSPKKEDRLLNSYCQATRWRPLANIHDFMIENSFQALNGESHFPLEETVEMEVFDQPIEMEDFIKGYSKSLIKDFKAEETLSHMEKAAISEILSYTGGGALETLLKRFDMALLTSFMASDLRDIYATLRTLLKNPKQTRVHTTLTKLLKRLLRRRAKTARRLKLANLFLQTKREPEWMMLSVLPVLPPKLRPIEQRDGLCYTSDLNRLYQMVLNRNRRFQKLILVDISTVTATQRLLQDAVDGLLENGKGGSKPFSHQNGEPLVSLSDKLKGKKGRFRLNLLGKRVDYSGRSVIVVEPKLKLHECGLPEEMALELFRSFLIRQLVVKGVSSNIILAKRLLKLRLPIIWKTLRELINHHPILLNRAPTLHRLGIQAFQPKLISGSAIKLHPLVCTGFNADFDGDQMAVHVPLSFHARAEAWNLLWSRNNLLSPATGQPILVPSQDMVLGWYYVSTMRPLKNSKNAQGEGLDLNQRLYNRALNSQALSISVPKDTTVFGFKRGYFSDLVAVLRAYYRQDLDLQSPIWLRFEGILECNNELEKPLELRVDGLGNSVQLYTRYQRQIGISDPKPALFVRTTPGRVLVNNLVHSKIS